MSEIENEKETSDANEFVNDVTRMARVLSNTVHEKDSLSNGDRVEACFYVYNKHNIGLPPCIYSVIYLPNDPTAALEQEIVELRAELERLKGEAASKEKKPKKRKTK
jgi:hypothetical protein